MIKQTGRCDNNGGSEFRGGEGVVQKDREGAGNCDGEFGRHHLKLDHLGGTINADVRNSIPRGVMTALKGTRSARAARRYSHPIPVSIVRHAETILLGGFTVLQYRLLRERWSRAAGRA